MASSNYYLAAVKQFCKWMVRDGRANESPVDHLQRLNANGRQRIERQALSADELRWLLDSTAQGGERFGMAPGERALLYRLAVETGLRADCEA